MVQFIVLGLLRDRGPRHGYALMKDYEARSGARASSGTFYRALRRLQGEQLIRIAAAPAAGDPRRASYEITASGETAIDRWLARPRARCADPSHDELSARAALIGGGDTATARRGLEHWRDELMVLSKAIERALAKAAAPDEAAAQPATRALILGRHLRHLSTDLEFIDQLRAVCETRRDALRKGRGVTGATPHGVPPARREGAHRPSRSAGRDQR